jgi:hypothetical protein
LPPATLLPGPLADHSKDWVSWPTHLLPGLLLDIGVKKSQGEMTPDCLFFFIRVPSTERPTLLEPDAL